MRRLIQCWLFASSIVVTTLGCAKQKPSSPGKASAHVDLAECRGYENPIDCNNGCRWNEDQQTCSAAPESGAPVCSDNTTYGTCGNGCLFTPDDQDAALTDDLPGTCGVNCYAFNGAEATDESGCQSNAPDCTLDSGAKASCTGVDDSCEKLGEDDCELEANPNCFWSEKTDSMCFTAADEDPSSWVGLDISAIQGNGSVAIFPSHGAKMECEGRERFTVGPDKNGKPLISIEWALRGDGDHPQLEKTGRTIVSSCFQACVIGRSAKGNGVMLRGLSRKMYARDQYHQVFFSVINTDFIKTVGDDNWCGVEGSGSGGGF